MSEYHNCFRFKGKQSSPGCEMKYLKIQIQNEIPEEEAQFLLESEGLTFLFFTEEKQFKVIATSYHQHPEQLDKKFSWILSIDVCEYNEVDWEEQWEIHGENYQDGLLEINLTPYNIAKSFKMEPGPGFGDLSHATTRLTLQQMIPLCQGKHVVDIGCGSGVLSLAAVAAGAKHVYAIDIDPKAIEHTKQNAFLNSFDESISYVLPKIASSQYEWLLVMNMIHSEQCLAWSSVKDHFMETPFEIITSGILAADKESYLQQTEQWGWQRQAEIQEGEWTCYHFFIKS